MRGAIVIAICSCTSVDDSLTDAEAREVATMIASTLQPAGGGGELGVIVDTAMLVRGQVPDGFTASDDGIVRGSHLDVSADYALACRDATNQARRCGDRTDNADIRAAWSGFRVISRDGAWIANDIVPDKLRIDGETRVETVSTERAKTSHDVLYEASYRNIVMARDERWPRGGLVRYEIASDRDQPLRAELTFHASGHATIVLPDHVYDLDLATRTLR